MAERYDILVKVVSQKGTCICGHKVGDEWLFGKDRKSPAGLCNTALGAIWPLIRMLQGDGSWSAEVLREAGHGELDPDISPPLACPDGDNPVLFRLQRLRE